MALVSTVTEILEVEDGFGTNRRGRWSAGGGLTRTVPIPQTNKCLTTGGPDTRLGLGGNPLASHRWDVGELGLTDLDGWPGWER